MDWTGLHWTALDCIELNEVSMFNFFPFISFSFSFSFSLFFLSVTVLLLKDSVGMCDLIEWVGCPGWVCGFGKYVIYEIDKKGVSKAQQQQQKGEKC